MALSLFHQTPEIDESSFQGQYCSKIPYPHDMNVNENKVLTSHQKAIYEFEYP